MMDGAVMTSEARTIFGLGGKCAGNLQVAYSALSLEHGVGRGHPAA